MQDLILQKLEALFPGVSAPVTVPSQTVPTPNPTIMNSSPTPQNAAITTPKAVDPPIYMFPSTWAISETLPQTHSLLNPNSHPFCLPIKVYYLLTQPPPTPSSPTVTTHPVSLATSTPVSVPSLALRPFLVTQPQQRRRRTKPVFP